MITENLNVFFDGVSGEFAQPFIFKPSNNSSMIEMSGILVNEAVDDDGLISTKKHILSFTNNSVGQNWRVLIADVLYRVSYRSDDGYGVSRYFLENINDTSSRSYFK